MSPGTPLSLESLDDGLFSVQGSRSGAHTGALQLSDDGLTALFYPDREFAYGEKVRVSLNRGLQTSRGEPVETAIFTFTVIDNLMPIEVAAPADGTGEGLIFLTSSGPLFSPSPGLFILNEAGEPIYLQTAAGGQVVSDFKRQTVGGVPYLTCHVGASFGGWSKGTFYFPWDALPAEQPRLALTASGAPSSATLYFSWNGATQIDSYDVYAGAAPTSTGLIANVPKTGIESSCADVVRSVEHVRGLLSSRRGRPGQDPASGNGNLESAIPV